MMKNMVYDEGNNIVRRRGMQRITETPIFDTDAVTELPIDALFYTQTEAGDGHWVAFAGTGAHVFNETKGDWDTFVQTGLTAGLQWCGVTFNGTFIATNGTDKMQKWAGTVDDEGVPTGWTTVDDNGEGGFYSNIPYPKYIAVHKNQLFAAVYRDTAGGEIHYNQVRYSPITPTVTPFQDWDANDIFNVKLNEPVSGILSDAHSDVLVITSVNQTEILTGSSSANFGQVLVSGDTGCLSQATMANTDLGLVWLSKQGVVVFDGSAVQKFSTNVDRYFRGFNTDRFEYACAAYYQGYNQQKKWYLLSVTLKYEEETLDYNNFILGFDFNRDAAAFTITGWDADCFAVGESENSDILYFGDRNGLVCRADYGFDDDGNPIDSQLILGPFTGGDMVYEKAYHNAHILLANVSPLTLKFTYSTDLENLEDSDGNTVLPKSRSIDFTGLETPDLFNSVKFDQEKVWENYAFKEHTIALPRLTGKTLFLGIGNSGIVKDYAIHGVRVDSYEHGMSRAV